MFVSFQQCQKTLLFNPGSKRCKTNSIFVVHFWEYKVHLQAYDNLPNISNKKKDRKLKNLGPSSPCYFGSLICALSTFICTMVNGDTVIQWFESSQLLPVPNGQRFNLFVFVCCTLA